MKPLFENQTQTATTTQSELDRLVNKPSNPAPVAVQPARAQSSVPTKKYTMADIDEIGKEAENRIGATTLTIVASVKASDTGEFGANLNKLIVETKGLDPKTLGKQGLISRVFHLGGTLKERMMGEFQSIKGRIDTLVAELDKTAANAKQRVDDCEHLYEENFQNWNALSSDIVKLQVIAGEIQQQIDALPAAQTGFDAQRKVDLEAMLDRANKRINDLQRGQTLATQAAPDIRDLQAGMRNLATTVRDLKVTTIPAYTAMFSRYIIAQEMKAGADLANAVADMTNEAFKKGADMMTDASIAVAKAQQRGVVDIETLEYMQEQATKRMDAVAAIVAEGKQKRAESEGRLKALEDHLIARSLPKSN